MMPTNNPMQKSPKKKEGEGISSKVSEFFTKKGKSAKEFLLKKKEDFEIGSWLKKARSFESKKEYKKALDAYLKFLEIKLRVIKERPEQTLRAYFDLIPYYIKIAECYRKTKHLRPQDRIVDMRKAAEFYQKAAQMCIEQKTFNQAYSCYEEASHCYQEIEEFDNAAKCYIKIAEMYYKIKSFLMSSTSYVKAGELYKKGMNFENAAKAYINASTLNLKIKNPREAILNYTNAGDCFERLRNYSESVKFYLEAVELSSELEHYQETAELYGKIGSAYEKLKDYVNGIHYYLKSSDLGDNSVKKGSYGGAGRCYESLNSYEESIEYYNRAANISSKLKENLEAALFYKDIARCYENLRKEEEAANFYFQYAEFGSLEGDAESKKGYEKASHLFIKNAKKFFQEKDYEGAIKNYKKAADCYEKLGKYEEAAKIFHNEISELELKRENYNEMIKAYLEGAKFYEKANNLKEAALAYRRAEDYKEAAKVYLLYASEEDKNKNLYFSANGYKNAADCYEELKDVRNSKANYAKAIHTYLKHIDKLEYMNVTKEDKENKGNTNRKIAECYIQMNDMPNAKKHLEIALEFYNENKMEKESSLTNALLSIAKADLAVKQGDYPNASQFLNSSISLIEESIKEGNFSKEYKNFLQKNKEKAKNLLKEIGAKPELTLLMDRHSYTFVDIPLLINALITNQSAQDVFEINFISHIPYELEISILPTPISSLKGGNSIKNSLEIIPKKVGEYRIRPLEVYYKDKEGNKYVKASNQVTIKVVEKPSMDYKDYRFTVNSYMEYAETQLKNKNYFHAGEGYRGVAETFGRFNEESASKENYERAIENYLKYIEELSKEELDVVKFHSLSETYRRIGECYEIINSLEDAETFYSKSLEFYEKTKEKTFSHQEKLKVEYQILVTKAFLEKVKAKFSIKHGNYEKANSLLEESIKFLEESIKKGDFSKSYEEFLEKNQREAKALMEDIKGKPAVSLILHYEKETVVNMPLRFNVKVSNEWDKPIYDLKFLIKLPSEFLLKTSPEQIQKLEPKSEKNVSIEIIPKALGEYKFKPFDLIYKDEKENNYMRGGDQISLKISQQKKVY